VVKILVTLFINLLSSAIFAISYIFQVAVITPSEDSVIQGIGSSKVICVNNIHAPKSPGMSFVTRSVWFLLVLTSLLIHGVMNDIIGVTNRYCTLGYQPWQCTADVTLRVLPLIIAGSLMTIKLFSMHYAYASYRKMAARGPVVESLRDVILLVNRYNREFKHTQRNEASSPLYGSDQPSRAQQASIFTYEKRLAWSTSIIGIISGAGLLAFGIWELKRFSIPRGFDFSKLSSWRYYLWNDWEYYPNNPTTAYFEAAAPAAIPHVVLALITFMDLSILETFYLNKAWVSLQHRTRLGRLRNHFTLWKPRTLPAAGSRGIIGILVFAILPSIGHFFLGLGLIPQEEFCDTTSNFSDGSFCALHFTENSDTGFDSQAANWTSYEIVINSVACVISAAFFLGATVVALWIGCNQPKQRIPPFYGRVEVVTDELRGEIRELVDENYLRWDSQQGIYYDGET